MWFITKSIFDYIVNTNLSKNKKADLVNDNKKRLKKEIKKLTAKQLVQYLFNSKIPNELKRLITIEINELVEKKDDTSKEKVEKLIKEFKKLNCRKEKFIVSDTCPDIFKSIVIDNIYGDNIVKTIASKTVSKNIKENLIRLKIKHYSDVIKLLSLDLNYDIENYILDNCLTDGSDMRRVIEDKHISERIKKRIIIEKINIDNLFSVMTYAYDETIELLFTMKEKEIKEYLDSLTYKNILNVFNDYNVPRKFLEYVFIHKEDVICKAIDKANIETIRNTMFKERNVNVVKILIERRPKILYRIINKLYDFQLLSWLNIKNLPLEYKKYIIRKFKNKLKSAINRLDTYDIKNYLKVESNVPREVQDLILEKCKVKLLDDITKKGDDELISTIRYSSLIEPAKRLLIQEKVNSSNFIKLLSEKYLDNETLMLVLELKKDLIKEYLKQYDSLDLFKLKIKNMNKDVIKGILEDNVDLIREKVRLIDKDDLIELFDDSDIHKIVKKVILEEFFVSEDDVVNILSLIECYDTKLILDNYVDIKEFVIKIGIDFGSFLQYGSGSRKYSNWLDKILEIIFEDKVEEFVKCKNYLFNNYYDNKNENSINVISNFLECLGCFSKYYELLSSLVAYNTELSTIDKMNISFLFNISSVEDKCPSNLDELAQFKLKVYDKYMEYIKSSRASLDGLKNIFNNVIFCDAQNILSYIGGTGALRTLKKDNINSPSIVSFIDELMTYSKMIEMVNDTNNKEGLRNVLNYIFGDINVLIKLQNIFSNFEKKITKLYEYDSNNNLTRISEISHIEECLDVEKSLEYGGKVYNFSDKNYCLYGHILSRKEKMEDMINGVSTGNSNFISVSPVSYRGQKYYWDRDNVIIAYDYVPSGNFICSSISNMGTNYKISNNSSEVGNINRMQRGILETSAVVENNAEALLYREGLKPCGLILPGNRKPSNREIEIHEKYGLPFIITQDVKKAIDSPNYVFSNNLEVDVKLEDVSEIKSIMEMLRPNVSIKKEDELYTGREVALFTDCHSMYEPTLAVLEDIRRRGIDEIYSLGDNVGLGPNPVEVFDLLEEYNVKSIAGNAEYYNTLGTEPFPYLVDAKLDNQLWTFRKLGQLRVDKLRAYPASIDLALGNKKFSLCHFANDVRWDFRDRSVHTYYKGYVDSKSSQQFKYTNSDEAVKKVTNCIVSNKDNISIVKGYVDAKGEPLFGGKLVTDYDCILQGHVHFEIDDKLDKTDIFTLRALSMGFVGKEDINEACYYVLRERKDGSVDIEKVYVRFNRNALLSSIHTSDLPSKDRVLSYVKKSR